MSGSPAASGRIYDAAIIGSGIGGTMLAAILARKGASVILIDEAVHPRFAVGESIVPETGAMFRVVAAKYDVPEIANLSTAFLVRRHISTNCGVKRAFSFVYQREGRPPNPLEITQFPTLTPPMGPDTHMFRQDIDAYLLAVAVKYGSEAVQKAKIAKVEREDPGYRIETSRGAVRCRFVVDAAGYNSPLAKLYGLREEPSRLRTDSRSIFTHMVGVRPYDECGPSRKEHGMPVAFHQSTLHHVFDGGWLWVIPFDNTPDSTNLLCSVGLVFDRRKFPNPEGPAEEEFRNFVSRYPTLETQFRNARSVREWTTTGRLQYSSRRLVGDRFCLLGHAAGFIDPLFSSGIGMTVSAVDGIAEALLPALAADDFSPERFTYFETWAQRNLDHYDCLVGRAFDSFANFTLWNSWFRIWVLSNLWGGLGAIIRHAKYLQTGDKKVFQELRQAPFRGMAAGDQEHFTRLMHQASEQVQAAMEGKHSPEEAASSIFSLIGSSGMAPTQHHLTDPNNRSTSTSTLLPLFRMYFWGRWRAPRWLWDTYFGSVRPPLRFGVLEEIRRQTGTSMRLARDTLFAWNWDWRRTRRADSEATETR